MSQKDIVNLELSFDKIWWLLGLSYLFSISCFMSIPCFSSSSLWAKVQSTGSTGVSAVGVFSRSARACSGWLNRNTWFFPMIMRLPEEWTGMNILEQYNSLWTYIFHITTWMCKVSVSALSSFNHTKSIMLLNAANWHLLSHCNL